MHQSVQLDQLTEGGVSYIYQEDGTWITATGYCVSTTQAHTLTMKFYQRHGRPPATPKAETAAPRKRPTTKAAKAKAAALRAAIAKAQAAKAAHV